jgi:hypothetical protein
MDMAVRFVGLVRAAHPPIDSDRDPGVGGDDMGSHLAEPDPRLLMIIDGSRIEVGAKG